MAALFSDDEVEVKSNFYENAKEYNFNDCNYSLLIVGPSGAGKSTFCNFLVQEKRFKEAAGMMAGTEEAAYFKYPHFDENVLVVDCPGFCDPKRPHEEILNEICKAAILCRDGVDAIAIVINPMDRFSESEKVSYEQIELFGGNFWKHSFILFSHEHKVKKKMEVNDAREYILKIQSDPNCPPQLTKLLNKVENRFMCVESSKRFKDTEYREKAFADIYAMILSMRECNKEAYVNTIMSKGKIAYDDLLHIKGEMDLMIDSMRFELDAQRNRLSEVEGRRCSESCYYTEKMDNLASDYEHRIIGFQSEIAELKNKKDKKPSCCIL